MNAKPSKREFNAHLIDVCEHIVRSIVKQPELVEVSLDVQREQLTILVSSADRGVVIGRGGQNLMMIESSLLLALAYLDQTGDGSPLLLSLPSLEVRAVNEA